MLEKVSKVFNSTFFKILILVTTLIMQVPFIHSAFGGYVKYVLAFGIIVACLEILSNGVKSFLNDKVNVLLLSFAFFYGVTIILNRESYFGENVKQLIYMVVFFILLFFVASVDIKNVSWVIVISTFLLSLLCFMTYILRIYEWYIIDDHYYIGQYGGLWGLYNPNTCGAIAAISIIVSLYLAFSNVIKKSLIKVIATIFLALNVVLQYLVLLLSSSRGAFYSLLVTIALLVFIYTVKNLKREKFSVFVRVLISIVLCMLVAFLILKVSTFIQTNRVSLYVVSEEDANNIEKDTSLENTIEELLKKYSTDSSAFAGLISRNILSIGSNLTEATGRSSELTSTTGRDVIWKAGFKTFLEKPIFGWSREGLVEPTVNHILEATGYDSEAVAGGGLHNIYLTILCSSGIVGFVLMAAIAVMVFFRFIKQLFKEEAISKELLFSFAMCMYFFISELVENRILYQVTFFNVVFWIYFGYMNYYSLKGNVESEKES